MKRSLYILIFLSALALDYWIWSEVYKVRQTAPEVRFLDVGQGDATLFTLRNGIQILTDAGAGSRIIGALERTIPSSDRYIDLGIITHAEADHFGGFLPLLARYKFGAIIWNGRDPDVKNPAWDALMDLLREKNIPLIALKEGDSIRIGEDSVSVRSPNRELWMSSNLNDGCLATMNNIKNLAVLLPCDGGFATEEHLLRSGEISSHVLKAGHHGSKFSSSGLFLKSAFPDVIVVSAGSGNSYGHPAPEALSRFQEFTSGTVFRTDKNGTVSLRKIGNSLLISTER